MTSPDPSTLVELQKRITSRVESLVPGALVCWERDPEDLHGWIVLVLNVERRDFGAAKDAVREYRDEVEALGFDILPMVKDVETTRRYYAKELAAGELRRAVEKCWNHLAELDWFPAFSGPVWSTPHGAPSFISHSSEEYGDSLRPLVMHWSSVAGWLPADFGTRPNQEADPVQELRAQIEGSWLVRFVDGGLPIEPCRSAANEELALAA